MLKSSKSIDENVNPNIIDSKSRNLKDSVNSEYQWKLKEYKNEIKRLLQERKRARAKIPENITLEE